MARSFTLIISRIKAYLLNTFLTSLERRYLLCSMTRVARACKNDSFSNLMAWENLVLLATKTARDSPTEKAPVFKHHIEFYFIEIKFSRKKIQSHIPYQNVQWQ